MSASGPVQARDDLVARFGRIVRDALAAGAGPTDLDPVMAAVADGLGCSGVAVLRRLDPHLVVHAAHGYDAADLPSGDGIALDDGIAGEVARSGEPVYAPDAQVHPAWAGVSGGRFRSCAVVPMRLADRLWGVLVAESEELDDFPQDVRDAMVPLADLLAWSLETLRLRHEAEARAEQEATLRAGLEASAAVITAGLQAAGTTDALDVMVRQMQTRLGWDSIAVLLLDDEGALRTAAAIGAPATATRMVFAPHKGVVGHVAVTGESHLVNDVDDDPYYLQVMAETRSELAVPLKVAGVVRGVVNVESPELAAFDATDLAVLERLAGQMSLVLHNVELLRSEKDTVARLHELDRLKSRLLTIASHELRTPLTVVLGFSEVLTENAQVLDSDQTRSYADAIARQARSLSKLVDHMLIAAEIEQGTLNVALSRVELGEVVREVASRFADADIQLGNGLDTDPVMADPFRLRQVFENLLSNAVKYASHGVIQVDAKTTGPTVTVLLRDEGPGIPGSEHEKVFELFHQHGEHGVAGRRGIGLGLAVARDLVRLMGGDLRLASAEGYGVTFLMGLPRG
ncbi:MAG TPA: GAF domain-containing protein [Nitriliruptorales bacterium]